MNKQLIAQRLREYRGDHSRELIANKLGISKSALQMYETAQRIPRDDVKIKIAKLYGVSVQEIFFDKINHKTCSEQKEQEVS